MGEITNVCICVNCASFYVTAKGVMKGKEEEGEGRCKNFLKKRMRWKGGKKSVREEVHGRIIIDKEL